MLGMATKYTTGAYYRQPFEAFRTSREGGNAPATQEAGAPLRFAPFLTCSWVTETANLAAFEQAADYLREEGGRR